MAYKRVVSKSGPYGHGRRVARMAMGMGAWSDLQQGNCGSDQKYDPQFVFPGLPPGQCVNQDQYNTYHASNPAPSSGGSFWDSLTAGLASALKPVGTQQTPVIVQGGGGIGTGTALAIGGGALALVYLLTRK